LHFTASANGAAGKGGRLPPKIESLIDRMEISAGGVTLSQGFNGYNILAHAKQALMGNKCDAVLGHPNLVRAKSYVDGSAIAGTDNEVYSDNNGATHFCIDKWQGFLGSCEPSIMDTALVPDLTLSIYLAGDEVLSSCAGVALSGTGNADVVDDNGSPGAKYTMSNFHLNCEVLGMADQVYENMVEKRIQQTGFVEVPFKNYFSFSDVHTGSTRWTVASQSLDRMWIVMRKTGYENQGGAKLVNGYKTSGAFTSNASGAYAGGHDVGEPGYDIGGVLGTNEERYLSKYFNFEETRAAAGTAPTYQLQINGAYIPQFKASAEEMYEISKNSVPKNEGCVHPDFKTLDQYKNNFFVQCIRLNLPESEAGREISGMDSRGISLNGYFNSTGVAATQNVMLFAECTSTLRIGAGRAVEVLI
jgi:hypothetical protein